MEVKHLLLDSKLLRSLLTIQPDGCLLACTLRQERQLFEIFLIGPIIAYHIEASWQNLIIDQYLHSSK